LLPTEKLLHSVAFSMISMETAGFFAILFILERISQIRNGVANPTKGKTGVKSRSLTLLNEKFTGLSGVMADWNHPNSNTAAFELGILWSKDGGQISILDTDQ
jgi:hypothetical protein